MSINIPPFGDLFKSEAEEINGTFIWYKPHNKHTFKITFSPENGQVEVTSTGPQTESALLSK